MYSDDLRWRIVILIHTYNVKVTFLSDIFGPKPKASRDGTENSSGLALFVTTYQVQGYPDGHLKLLKRFKSMLMHIPLSTLKS